MGSIIILVFVFGYLTITLEHPLKLDKTVPALLMAALMWALLAVGFHQGWFSVINTEGHIFNYLTGGEEAQEGFHNLLLHHFGKTSEILIFLIGAMTIVEIIDLHRGFDVIKKLINTKNKAVLLWIIITIAFILSAVIDNMTATIVIITLLRKLIKDKEARIWFVSLAVLAANSGGVWSPVGDLTTTMLWNALKVSVFELIKVLIIPSMVSAAVPALAASFLPAFRGSINIDATDDHEEEHKLLSSTKMLLLGFSVIIFVPIFKTITHLPPYLGMMLGLGIVWLVSEFIHPEEDFTEERKHLYSPHKALSRIEMSSILFFLGILLSVAALETLVYGVTAGGEQVGTLRYLAEVLDSAIPNQSIVIMLLGVLSAIIDNVPLVAASMGMYDAPMDASIWHLIAYASGTGGSMLIIGSAAGVAAMGMEKIDFIWYLKNITWLAAIGYVAGYLTLLLMQ